MIFGVIRDLASIAAIIDTRAATAQIKACQMMEGSYRQPAGAVLNMQELFLAQKTPQGTVSLANAGPENRLEQMMQKWKGKLKSAQIEALEKSITLKGGVHLIHGPPGSGKTATLVAVLEAAVRSGHTVLVTAPSDAATDELFQKVLDSGFFEDISMLRFSSPYSKRTQEIGKTHVIFVTCNSSAHDYWVHIFKPTLLIIDDAGQATEPEITIPMANYSSTLLAIVMCGNPEQGPDVQSRGRNEYFRQLAWSPLARFIERGIYSTTLLTVPASGFATATAPPASSTRPPGAPSLLTHTFMLRADFEQNPVLGDAKTIRRHSPPPAVTSLGEAFWRSKAANLERENTALNAELGRVKGEYERLKTKLRELGQETEIPRQ